MGLSSANIRCLYCENVLTEATKPEHILLDCLGGKKTSRRVICSAHNETFGQTIDKVFGEQVHPIRNLLQLMSGSGNTPPALRNVPYAAGGGTVNIKGDGSFDNRPKPFTITTDAQGQRSVQIHARDPQHIEELIPHIAAALKIPEEHLRKDMATNSSAKSVEQRPDAIKLELRLGGDGLRSVAKSLLSLWALATSNYEVRGAPFAAARNFVLLGDKTFQTTLTHLDSRYLPDAEAFHSKYGPFFNMLYLRSDENGRLIGHFTFYNLQAWQFELASSGATPNTVACLISNPLVPTVWSDDPSAVPDVPMTWLQSPDYIDDFKRANERMTVMMEHWQKASTDREVDRITKEVFDKCKGKSAFITQEMINEIAHRLSLFAVGAPYEEAWTKEDFDALINKKDAS